MPRNKTLNEKMKDERRRQIFSNALIVFSKKGLSAAKISDIAAVSGFSQGLIYHYFKSKEELFTELINHAFDKLNTACMHLEQLPASPREKIEMAIRELLKGFDQSEDTAGYHLLISQATMSEAVPQKTKTIIKKQSKLPYEVMERIIRAGQKEGSIKKKDPGELAVLFWTSIKGLALHKAVHGRKFSMPDPEILMSMFL